jgi:transglutaminase-like putative cysteine protease
VIDFDEPAVRALHAELTKRHGARPGLDELRGFTRDSIPRTSLERGWDFASRVAGSGTGDCTEHAVLLTALARAVGRPARVVTGLLIVSIDGEPQALGHAWSEIHEGGRWLRVDATPIADEAAVLAYLPLVLLLDEGPGYMVGLGVAIQRSWVRSIEVVNRSP